MKNIERVGIWLLALAGITAILFALGLLFFDQWEVRKYLEDKLVLGQAINLFGILAGSFVAAIALLYVNKQIQTYSWRRDQAMKDIKEIYEPLYTDISLLVKMTEELDFSVYGGLWKDGRIPNDYATDNYSKIIDSFLGTKLKLMDSKIYERVVKLPSSIKDYCNKRSDMFDKVVEIENKTVESHLLPNLDSGQKENILGGFSLQENYQISTFLMGKPGEHWGAQKNEEDKKQYIEYKISNSTNKGWWEYQQFSPDEVETMLNEFYKDVQENEIVKQIVRWTKDFNEALMKLMRDVEGHIIKPQLP